MKKKDGAKKIKRLIRRSVWGSAALAAALSPVPFADELLLAPFYAWATRRVAELHGQPLRSLPLAGLTRTALIGLGARAGLNAGVAFVPGLAALVNAGTAALLTHFYLEEVERRCALPRTPAVTRGAPGALRGIVS
jgi:uncharacterized protein (DUF697 family)